MMSQLIVLRKTDRSTCPKSMFTDPYFWFLVTHMIDWLLSVLYPYNAIFTMKSVFVGLRIT